MEKYILDRNNSLLLIVDIQEKLAAVMSHRQKVVDNTVHLIELSKMLNIPVVITEQYPKGIGPTVKEIREAVPEYEPLIKMTFDCCGHDGFSDRITSFNRKQIILTGMETHICVLQTCLSLLKQSYPVHLVSDAVCSRKKHDFKTGKAFMHDAGAVVTTTETVLFQLLEEAGTPEFKSISKRIK